MMSLPKLGARVSFISLTKRGGLRIEGAAGATKNREQHFTMVHRLVVYRGRQHQPIAVHLAKFQHQQHPISPSATASAMLMDFHTGGKFTAAAATQPSEDRSSFMKNFKEKGFGIPTDVNMLKQKTAEIPSLDEIRAKGMRAIPGYDEFRTSLRDNMPRSFEELKAMTPSMDEIVAKGRANMPKMQEIKKTPFPAFVLGMVGVLPFFYPPWKFLLSGHILPGWEFFQLMYGACVLSFLGGVRWGIIVRDDSRVLKPDWANLGLGVATPLIALFAMVLPPFLGNCVLMAGLSLSAYIDLLTPSYPQWYKALRVVLTVGAISFLSLTLFFKLILSRKEGKFK